MAKNKRPDASSKSTPAPPPVPAGDLSRYLDDKLPTADRHRLESRFLDSSFHADAAEGLAADAAEASAAMAELTKRLENRVNTAAPEPVTAAKSPTAAATPAAAVIPPQAPADHHVAPQLSGTSRRQKKWTYWAIGAVVVLIVGGLWIQNSYKKFTNEEALAAKSRRAANYRGEDAQPKGFFESLFSSDDEPTAEDIAKRQADSLQVVAQADAARRLESQRRQELEAERRQADEAAAVAAAPVAAPAPAPRVERPAEPAVRRMRGQITSDAGTPISGASITLRATGKKVSAGADGWYTIDVPAGVEGAIDVEAPGFMARSTKANAEGQANVQLSTVEAVAVRSMASAAAAEKRTKSVRPEPEGGYGNYYRYIAGAAKLPAEAKKASIAGQVQVEFQVNTDGTLSNFHVVQGLGYGCDEEAVRIIQDGPKWTPGKVNDEPVAKPARIPVPFGR